MPVRGNCVSFTVHKHPKLERPGGFRDEIDSRNKVIRRYDQRQQLVSTCDSLQKISFMPASRPCHKSLRDDRRFLPNRSSSPSQSILSTCLSIVLRLPGGSEFSLRLAQQIASLQRIHSFPRL